MNIKKFFQSINKSDIEAIKEQMQLEDFDINSVSLGTNCSGLQYAATIGNIKVVRFLLDIGEQHELKVDSKNIDGVTPLYSAVMHACSADKAEEYATYLEIIALLLNAGANCEESNKAGITALRHAEVRDKRKKVFNLLRANSKSEFQQSIEHSNENESRLHQKNLAFISSTSPQTKADAATPAEKKPTLGFLESIYGLFSFGSPNSKANGPESSPLLSKLKKE